METTTTEDINIDNYHDDLENGSISSDHFDGDDGGSKNDSSLNDEMYSQYDNISNASVYLMRGIVNEMNVIQESIVENYNEIENLLKNMIRNNAEKYMSKLKEEFQLILQNGSFRDDIKKNVETFVTETFETSILPSLNKNIIVDEDDIKNNLTDITENALKKQFIDSLAPSFEKSSRDMLSNISKTLKNHLDKSKLIIQTSLQEAIENCSLDE